MLEKIYTYIKNSFKTLISYCFGDKSSSDKHSNMYEISFIDDKYSTTIINDENSMVGRTDIVFEALKQHSHIIKILGIIVKNIYELEKKFIYILNIKIVASKENRDSVISYYTTQAKSCSIDIEKMSIEHTHNKVMKSLLKAIEEYQFDRIISVHIIIKRYDKDYVIKLSNNIKSFYKVWN